MDQAVHNKIVSFTRLIADVVTGKLDVREMAAKLPDLPEDASGELETADDNEVEAEVFDATDSEDVAV